MCVCRAGLAISPCSDVIQKEDVSDARESAGLTIILDDISKRVGLKGWDMLRETFERFGSRGKQLPSAPVCTWVRACDPVFTLWLCRLHDTTRIASVNFISAL